MLLLFILVTVLTFVYIIFTATKNLDYWKKRGVKHLKPLPFVGNFLPQLIKSKSLPEFVKWLYDAFPNERFAGILQLTTPILLVRDPELIKSITIKNFDNFVDHVEFATVEADPLWRKNLFASEGERWRDLRQTLSPVFTSSKMKAMFVLMDECAEQLTNYFKQDGKNLINVELKNIFTKFTNDVIANTAFGIKCDSLQDPNNDFLVTGKKMSDFTGLKRFNFVLAGNYPKLAKLLKIKMIGTEEGNFFKNIISENISVREKTNIIRPDLIHLLMLSRKGKLKYEDYIKLPEAGFAAVTESNIGQNQTKVKYLTDEDITAQAIVFFIGGYDTSASLMSFTGYEIAVNPSVQKKLREEIAMTHKACDGKITYENLFSMKYLDMVISESLRKWPQAPFLNRKCTKPFEIEPERPGEPRLKVNVGDVIWIPSYGIHMDPKYYPNPDKFDPERFSEENAAKIQSATYIPFGIGPRNCIGSRFALLETKILLYRLLLEFELVPTEDTQIPLKFNKNTALSVPEKLFHMALKRNPVV